MATDGRSANGIPGDPGALRMRSFRDGETHVIRLVGELDLASAGDVGRELRCVERTDARVIAVDLRDLTFIDTTGIRLIVQAHRRFSRGSNRLVLVRGTEAVQRHFEICDLATRLPFVDRLPSHDGAASTAGSPRAMRAATSRRVSQGALAAAVWELRTRRRPGIFR